VTKLLLLIAASVRTRLRWASRHIYSWLILAPIVVGLGFATVAQLAGQFDPRSLKPSVLLCLAAAFDLSVIGISLSRATAEIYHVRRPESQFEALPIAHATHLHAALIARLARTAIVALVVLAIISRFGPGLVEGLRIVLPLALFVLLTALAEMLAALNWIHWGHKRERLIAFGAAVTVLSTALLAGLMVMDILGFSRPRNNVLWPALSIASAAMLYLLIRISHARWRASDVEYANRLQRGGRAGVVLIRALTSRLGSIVRAQVARDLQLTLRGFSSAVYLAVAFAVLWPAALITLLTSDLLPLAHLGTGWLDATWLPVVMSIKIACLLAIVSMAALLPVLLGYELPHFWLERAAGTTGLDMWQAKVWYARFVSMPAPLVVFAAGLLTGKSPMFYALPLLAECLWMWWLVSSIIGALSFEIPARPGLGVILVVMVGLTAGVLTAMAWPVGLLIYVQAMHSLTDRGRQRARYYLTMGED
jgi:hypothetical protein